MTRSVVGSKIVTPPIKVAVALKYLEDVLFICSSGLFEWVVRVCCLSQVYTRIHKM